jgi:SAM-dependent methyltransferase
MLHIFRRRGSEDPSPLEGTAGPVLASHILAKFLRRLRAMQRPHLLDLGRLSGVNIEFFARAGCKVQVEDLLHASDEAAPLPPLVTDAAPETEAAAGPGPAAPAVAAPAAAIAAPSPAAAASAGPGASRPAPAGSAPRAGGRPTRRIVLPPRTFPKAEVGGRALPGRPAAWRCNLPSAFDYPDESFDAIVAWDVFNYYDPETVHAVASETRRVLKPGGLVLAYFHARRLDGPDSPPRYQILDEKRVGSILGSGRRLMRQVYQNRDIEKMFAGLRIAELYFLKNSVREILLEKKAALAPSARRLVRPAEPKPRFTLE